MKYLIYLSNIFFIAAISMANAVAAEPPPELVQDVNNSFICVFKDDVPAANAPGLAKGLVNKQNGAIRHHFTTAIKGFSARMSANAAENIVSHNPNIAYCEPNGLAQADGLAGGKGGKGGKPSPQPAAQITPAGVTMVGGPVDVTGWGLTAWIIDSGIDVDHPDLNVDVSRGANFVSKGKSTIDDGNGHGTHVAGTLAAIDNDIDVVGVAAGATVVPVRVLHNSNWATYDDMIAGIDYVAAMAQPGDVANMSIWAHEHVDSLHQATIGLANKIPFVVIAGNDGEDVNLSPSEPAHVEHANLYTVSAVDFNGQFTSFSNFGSSDSGDCSTNDPYPCAAVDIAAPGQDVTSLQPGGGLATWYGTSMAAPHVAGVILLLGGNPPTTAGIASNDPDNQPDPIVKYFNP
jgi:subtilisin family serine protease